MKSNIANYLCYFARDYFEIVYPGCELNSTLDNTSPTATPKVFWHGLTTSLDIYLELARWYMICMSIFELLQSSQQLVFLLKIRNLSAITRYQTNGLISFKMLHRFWLARNLVKIAERSFLLYALIWEKPELLFPWLVIYGTMMLADIVFLVSALSGIRFGTLTAYLLPLWNIYCANYLRTYTAQVVENDRTFAFTELFQDPSLLLRLFS